MLIVDYPHTDPTDWTCATEAAIGTAKGSGTRVAVVATLPELMPEETARYLAENGVVPMHGLSETIAAAEASASARMPAAEPVLLPGGAREAETLSEAEAKAKLAEFGLKVPVGQRSDRSGLAALAEALQAPLVLKGEGAAHKSEAGLVRLGLAPAEVPEAAAAMPSESFLLEEMVPGAVAELLVGVTRDPAHGFCLTLGAGGTMTELLADTQTLLIPAAQADVEAALKRLRTWPLLAGFRGKPAADLTAVLAAVDAIQSYVVENATRVEEVEINPLLCTPSSAVAADALIREAKQ
jgi:acyl-CoA synthetase (NDP forming)